MEHLRKYLRIKKIFVMLAVCTVMLAVHVENAAAVSMGPYVDLSSGSGEYEWDTSSVRFDVDSTTKAIGFALDTSPLDEKRFNYRLNIGLEGQELEDEFGVIVDVSGIYCENIFGFAINKKSNFRWWAGPLIRIGFYSGESDTYYASSTPYKTEYDLAQFGVGVATGLNFKTGKHVILAPSVGVRFIGVAGTGTTKNLNTFSSYDEDITGNSTNIFFNFSILF